MRTIAGQIQNFSFPKINWQQTLGAYVAIGWGQQLGIGQDADDINVDGNEHLGATFGSITPLPDLEQDIVVPDGYRMSIQYPVELISKELIDLWFDLTGLNGKVKINDDPATADKYPLLPDENGPIQLFGMSILASGLNWTYSISGIYAPPPKHVHIGKIPLTLHPPKVPFVLTLTETIFVAGTIPESTSLSYRAYPADLNADLSAINAYIDQIVNLVGASSLVTGVVGAGAAVYVRDLVEGDLALLPDVAAAQLTYLRKAYDRIPQRFRVGDTGTDEIIFHYDQVNGPQGLIAGTSDTNQLSFFQPGAILEFLGLNHPVETRIIGYVAIAGPKSIALIGSSVPGHSEPVFMQHPYNFSLVLSTEIDPKSIDWSLSGPTGQGASNTLLAGNGTRNVTVSFNVNNEPSPPGKYDLTVTVVDKNGILGQHNDALKAGIGITVTQQEIAIPKGNGGIITPIEAQFRRG